MRRFLVVLIAMMTSVGVLAPNAYADARDDFIEAYDNIPPGGDRTIDPRDFATTWEYVCAVRQASGLDCVTSLAMPTGVLAQGTPAQVKGGTARSAITCKSKVMCLLVNSLGIFGITQAADWLQPDAPPQTDWPIQTYPSQWAWPASTVSPINTGSWSADSFQFTYTRAAPCSPDFGGTCYSNIVFAADCLNPGTGDRFHNHRRYPDQVQTNAASTPNTFTVGTVCGTGKTVGQGWVVERLHFTQLAADAPSVATPASAPDTRFDMGFSNGFYWGKEQVPDTLVSRTGCQRPDGTTYDVDTPAIGSGVGGVNIAACQAGDSAIWQELLSCDPTGAACDSQSVLNLRRAPDPGIWPQCSSAQCILSVEVNGNPCSVGTPGCTNWTGNKEDAACYYGPYQVPLEMCYFLERAYQPGGVPIPASDPNTDGDPDTHEGPTPQLDPLPQPSPTPTRIRQPQPSATPTGTQTPNTDPTTRPTPSSTSTTTTGPSTPPSPGPNPEPPGQPGAPNPSDPVGQKCFPSGWAAFNPVQWVLIPLRCAFEPDPALTRTRVGTIRDTLAESGPGPAVAEVQGIFGSIPSGGGCAGPSMSFALNGKPFTLNLFSACEEPMSTAASYARILASVVIVTTGVLSIARALSVAFGFNFSMGRGSSGD